MFDLFCGIITRIRGLFAAWQVPYGYAENKDAERDLLLVREHCANGKNEQ
jgi:hypothetical protein